MACQETGHIWSVLRKKPQLTLDRILALCVGDTIDFKPPNGGRKAFPKNKAALLAVPRGDEMFAIARQALVGMAQFIPGFPVSNPNKFCHGYGMFQLDLQFFKDDPDYFLEKRYEKFSETLARCIGEMTVKAKKIGLFNKPSLSDMELTAVAIAYNTGNFIPSKGLMQGFFDGQKFYGQHIFEFIRMAHTVAVPGGSPMLPPPPPGSAIVPPPTPVEATGPFLIVDTQFSPLRVRSAPKISSPPTANVIAELPDGHPVRAITGTPVKNFIEIETSLSGAHIRGFASADFLVAAPADLTEIPVVRLTRDAPTSGVVEVFMPRRPGLITKRTEVAGAHSLNEPDMPARRGETPDELTTSLNEIIDYLASDKPSHKRYKPRQGLTFCNIYAHDYCFLAGVYLPRVWWTPGAIERLTQGEAVQPLIDNTIMEMRANALFRWLRDFGPRFGWRQTSTLTKLQQEANVGAVGLIVARRKQDGRSGHIVAVVPETNDERAVRNSAGEVTKPLQSQAGSVNFRRDTSNLNWWKGDQFAESAFWLHA
ncbi:MAG: SH3 domain-containing protein [Tardiphaga sp.]